MLNILLDLYTTKLQTHDWLMPGNAPIFLKYMFNPVIHFHFITLLKDITLPLKQVEM